MGVAVETRKAWIDLAAVEGAAALYQDILARRARMLGKEVLWLPGTDHAGIATQAVVEKRLKELEGLTRHELGREGLVARIWQWKDQYQAEATAEQLAAFAAGNTK